MGNQQSRKHVYAANCFQFSLKMKNEKNEKKIQLNLIKLTLASWKLMAME